MIKVKINNTGYLEIRRNKSIQEQTCPFKQGKELFCGDWCPLFSEPTFSIEHRWDERNIQLVHLSLCKKEFTLKTTEFLDERGN